MPARRVFIYTYRGHRLKSYRIDSLERQVRNLRLEKTELVGQLAKAKYELEERAAWCETCKNPPCFSFIDCHHTFCNDCASYAICEGKTTILSCPFCKGFGSMQLTQVAGMAVEHDGRGWTAVTENTEDCDDHMAVIEAQEAEDDGNVTEMEDEMEDAVDERRVAVLADEIQEHSSAAVNRGSEDSGVTAINMMMMGFRNAHLFIQLGVWSRLLYNTVSHYCNPSMGVYSLTLYQVQASIFNLLFLPRLCVKQHRLLLSLRQRITPSKEQKTLEPQGHPVHSLKQKLSSDQKTATPLDYLDSVRSSERSSLYTHASCDDALLPDELTTFPNSKLQRHDLEASDIRYPKAATNPDDKVCDSRPGIRPTFKATITTIGPPITPDFDQPDFDLASMRLENSRGTPTPRETGFCSPTTKIALQGFRRNTSGGHAHRNSLLVRQ